MKRILPFLFICISNIYSVSAQNLSYSCPRSITVSCGAACLTLNVKFPDIRNLATDYSFENVSSTSACYPLVNPGVPGNPTNLSIDDTYSPAINLPFSFPFFGTSYNSLVVSTNGYVCFDITRAGLFSHYSTSAGDLPNTGYDRALIMGPYHDLDPAYTTSPTMRINYLVYGNAPNRKWILSFYKVPLFLTSCQNLIQNTHQIIIHESSGIVEVSVFDKEICTAWNNGKAMIGMQDYNRTTAVMAPGRKVSDPPWGSIGMNETWRFVPKNGTPLYQSLQLLDATGAVIATGDTSRLNANTFEWNFPNVCPPPNVPTIYVVKTTYKKIDDPTATFYSLDTINVLRQNSLPANVTSNPTTCGASVGTITITPTAGTSPFTYVLNGGAPQTAAGAYTYTGLAAGPYTIVVTDANGCTNTLNVTVNTTTSITGTILPTPTSCPLSADGTITVTPTSGTAPYTYSLDGGASQGSNIFTNVAAGPHTVTFTDFMGCTGSLSITITAGSTPITANVIPTPTTCPTLNDGVITINPTSGTPAYQYRLDGGAPQASNIFSNVPAGVHTVVVTDLYGCTGTFNVTVAMGTSLTSSIVAVNLPCNNVINGTITINPTSGTAPYTYSLDGGPFQPGNIFTNVAAGPHTLNFRDVNGCTGTNSVTLTTNSAITATSTLVQPLCNGNNNGSITVNALGGVAPYQYSKDGGATYQAGAIFTGLTAGTYNFLVKDALGCIYGFSFTLNQPTLLNAFAFNGISTCTNNDGSINITAGGGTTAYQYSIDNGVTYQPSNIFNNLPRGSYNNIKVKDANGCIANTSAVVSLNDTMRLDLGIDSTICFASSITLLPQTNALTDSFKWTPAATLNYDTVKNPIASPTDTTKYFLTAKWGICQRRDSITINILHKPVAYAGKDTTICFKTNATLKGRALNVSGGVNYSWAPPDSLNTPNAASTIARIDTTRKFTLTVTDNYGCNFSVTDSMWVFMQAPVKAFAGNDTNAILGKPHQMLGNGGTNYLWSPASPLNNPFIGNPLATLYNDTYFSVLVTDAFGCTGTDDVFIKVYEGPTYYIPNAFSPNRDGLNDIFRPIPVGMQSTSYFRVFNRFGQQMYETNKWLQGWDGTFNGKPALGGTYVWMIKGNDKNGKVVEMQGTVILVR